MINYEDVLKGKRTIQMANVDNPEMLKLGLKPLYEKVWPTYINLSGNCFLYGTDHYECQLSHDIVRMLKLMNSDEYERTSRDFIFKKDAHTINLIIYKNQIFFDSPKDLEAFKRYDNIRKDIIEKYGLNNDFYEPTEIEIYKRYYEKILCAENGWSKVRYITYNLLPKEYLEIFYKLKQGELKLCKEPDKLSGIDVREFFNRNANIFEDFKNPLELTGAYNLDAMKLINSVKQTKMQIYDSLHNLAIKSKDMKKTVKDLLIELRAYIEYETWLDIYSKKYPSKEEYWLRYMYYKASYDLLVQFVGFDKIETSKFKTITTTKNNIYEEFFNLILMDWDIVQIPKLIFDEDNQQFRWLPVNDLITTGINRECEEELKLIKKHVPYDERYKYLRK